MASLVPPVDTVYTSFDHFKLDMYDRGCQFFFLSLSSFSSLRLTCNNKNTVKHSTNLIVMSSSQVGCNIKDDDGAYCDLRVVTEIIDGEVTVVRLVPDHSCSEQERRDREETARVKLREKIQKVKEDIRGMSRGSREKALSEGYQRQLEEEAHEEVDSSEEADSEEGSISFIGSDSSINSDSSIEEPLYKKAKRCRSRSEPFRKVCPPAQDVQSEINELKNVSTLILHTPDLSNEP